MPYSSPAVLWFVNVFERKKKDRKKIEKKNGINERIERKYWF